MLWLPRCSAALRPSLFPSSSSLSSFSTTQPTITTNEWHNALDHPDFEWLRAPNGESNTPSFFEPAGKFLRVPFLGDAALPKGLTNLEYSQRDDGSLYLPFFNTSSRVALLQRLHTITRHYQQGRSARVSISPAGPQGVGKSMYCYLIATYAAVNRFPLIYIPLVTQWAVQNAAVAARPQYFVRQFVALNKHWFPSGFEFYDDLQNLTSIKTPAQQEEAYRLQGSILLALDQGFDGLPKTTPRFTVLDEHSELFRGDKPLVEREHDYFRPFCNWTLGGVTVLCGSAHSKFLSSMPGGTTRSIVELQPFTEEETVTYLTSEESPDSIPGLTEEQARQVFADYGGIPRILSGFKEAVESRLHAKVYKTLEEGLAKLPFTAIQSQQELDNRFSRYCKEMLDCNPSAKARFIELVDRWFFSKSFSSPPYYGDALLDPGIFYKQFDQLYPINKFATQLVLDRHAEYQTLKPLSTCSPAEMREELERYVLRALRKNGKLEYKSIFADESGSQGSFQLPNDVQVQNFAGTKDFEKMTVGRKVGVTVYHPPPGFPRVDFMIVNYGIGMDDATPKVYLLQTTVSDPIVAEHARSSSGKDWEGFFGLTDNPGGVTWASLCKHLGLNAENVPVDYIYITTKSTGELSRPKSRPENLPSNVTINVMTKESLGQLLIPI